jgi:multidrug transporter EmrE-like cation transporter
MKKAEISKKGIPIAMIFVTTLFQASASALIKYGMTLMKTDPANKIFILVFLAAMLCYGIAFPIYTWCLSRLNLSIAQPVVSGSMFLYTILISILFFKESFALVKAVGFAAIIGGIVVVVL